MNANDASGAAERRPTVQLLHELPDGSSHVDWMIAIDPPAAGDDRNLATLRLAQRVDALSPGETIDALLLPPHRNHYLTYEGDIGEGRGSVRRLVRGEATWHRRDEEAWVVNVRWMPPDSGTTSGTLTLRAVITVQFDGPGGSCRLSAAPV